VVITELNSTECKALLTSTRMGRLGCSKDGQPYIVPIQFVLDGIYLYSFSLQGQKVEWMRANPLVCVQVDEFGEQREWQSVIVNGRYEELPDRIGWKRQRDHAWSLLSKHANWWEPGGMKPITEGGASHLFYRIVIEQMTGRRARTVP